MNTYKERQGVLYLDTALIFPFPFFSLFMTYLLSTCHEVFMLPPFTLAALVLLSST